MSFKNKRCKKTYKEKFPDVKIIGYTIDSLINETTVDEKSTTEMFEFLDKNNIFIVLIKPKHS